MKNEVKRISREKFSMRKTAMEKFVQKLTSNRALPIISKLGKLKTKARPELLPKSSTKIVF